MYVVKLMKIRQSSVNNNTVLNTELSTSYYTLPPVVYGSCLIYLVCVSAYSGVLFLFCFSSSCVLAVSLSCPYLIDTSVFSNVYLL